MRFLFFFIITLSIYAKGNYFWQMNESQINNKIISLSESKNTYTQKVKTLTELFMKTPYILNVLGEGKKKPLYSFKGVDCVTYIESVLAISNSKNLKDSINFLQKIRYKNGEIRYNKRNHFMMSQWIPNNKKLGLIEELTDKVSKNIKIMEKSITKSNFDKKFKAFKILNEDLPIGEYKIKYIPINKFIKYQNKLKIKDGTIMVVIRENRKDYPIFTSHLGFIINGKKSKIFRSAVTNSYYKEVRDYNLGSYLRFYSKYYSKTSWKIVGVSLYSPKDLNESGNK